MKNKLRILSHQKAIKSFCIVISCCAIFCGCSIFGGVGKDCKQIAKSQSNLKESTSGHMTILSKMSNPQKTDRLSTEFIYKMNAQGVLEYCQTQMDETNKMTFCEISEGERAEQWLLGKGWGTVEPVKYSKENPHRYIGILANPIEEKLIKKSTQKDYGTNIKYTLELDAKKLNDAHYKDAELLIESQELSFIINKSGELVCYTDNAAIIDKSTNVKTDYSLEIQLSEINAVSEIVKPELRADAAANAATDTNANAAADADADADADVNADGTTDVNSDGTDGTKVSTNADAAKEDNEELELGMK